MMGETEAALSILSAALKETERTGEKCYDAELQRGIGEAARRSFDASFGPDGFRPLRQGTAKLPDAV